MVETCQQIDRVLPDGVVVCDENVVDGGNSSTDRGLVDEVVLCGENKARYGARLTR